MKPITRDTIDRVIERLRRNEMQAHYFPNAAEAKEEVLRRPWGIREFAVILVGEELGY